MTAQELIATIRAEIERRITDNTFGAKLELIDILAWLDTLESEKPMNQEGLEEEIKRYYDDWDGNCRYAQTARHFAQWGAEHFRDTTKKIEPPCHTVEEWIEHIKNADQLTKDIFSKGPYDVLYDALNHPYQHCYDAIKEFGELCYASGLQDKQEHSSVPKDLEEAAEESWQNGPDKGIYDEYSPFYKDGFIAGAKWQKEQMLKEAVKITLDFTHQITLPFDGPGFGKKGDKIRVIIVKED